MNKHGNSGIIIMLVLGLLSFYLIFSFATKILNDVGNTYAIDSTVHNYTNDGNNQLQQLSTLFPAIGLVLLLIIALYILSQLF